MVCDTSSQRRGNSSRMAVDGSKTLALPCHHPYGGKASAATTKTNGRPPTGYCLLLPVVIQTRPVFQMSRKKPPFRLGFNGACKQPQSPPLDRSVNTRPDFFPYQPSWSPCHVPLDTPTGSNARNNRQ